MTIKKDEEKFSAASVMFFCLIYGSTGLCLSLVNKKIYVTFGVIDPMNLLFVQTASNFLLCLLMMTIKTVGITNFTCLKPYGLDVPTF